MALTAQIEPYVSCIEEIKPFFSSHWEELALYKDKMPLAPRYEAYEQAAKNGELIMPILRKDGRVIGYWPTFVSPGLHYGSTLTAKMDILWVHPDERNGRGSLLLYDALLKELKRRGVKVWFVGSKNHKSIEVFFERLGFEPCEKYFSQWIGD